MFVTAKLILCGIRSYFQVEDDEYPIAKDQQYLPRSVAVFRFYLPLGEEALVDNFALYLLSRDMSQEVMEMTVESVEEFYAGFREKYADRIRERYEKLCLLR